MRFVFDGHRAELVEVITSKLQQMPARKQKYMLQVLCWRAGFMCLLSWRLEVCVLVNVVTLFGLLVGHPLRWNVRGYKCLRTHVV